MRKRWTLLAAVLTTLVLVGAGCDTGGGGGTGGDDENKKTVKIAFVGAQTGPFNPLVIHAIEAAKMAVDQANESGDLDVNVELEVFDTQGSPDQATTLKDKFIPDESFIGVIGGAFSGETKALIPSLQEAGLVMISPSATNTKLHLTVCQAKDPNATACPEQTVFHRVVPDDDVQGKGVADYVTKVLKLKKLAYSHDNSDYGKGVAEGTATLLTAAGVSNGGTFPIDPASQDFSAAVNQIKGSGAEAVFYGGYAPQAGPLAKQLKDAGFTGRFLSGDGTLDTAFVTAAGGVGAEGAIITCACKLPTPDSEGELGEFAKDYKKDVGKDPGVYSGEGWDSAQIFLKGIEEGAITRKAMLEFVEGVKTFDEGISKKIEFDEAGNQLPADVFVHEIKNGKIVVLGTVAELTK